MLSVVSVLRCRQLVLSGDGIGVLVVVVLGIVLSVVLVLRCRRLVVSGVGIGVQVVVVLGTVLTARLRWGSYVPEGCQYDREVLGYVCLLVISFFVV